jgi:uncharacterized protein YbaP (TraB family)
MRRSYKTAFHVFIILLSFLLLLNTSCDCQNQDTAQSQTPTDVSGKSFIWKISSDTTSVYLLGSVHVARPDIYPLDSSIEDAFDSANYLVVEVNTSNLSQVEAIQLLSEYGQYPEGEWLSKNLPEKLYEKLEMQLQEFNIAISFLDSYRPFVIYNMMSQLILESLGYKSEYGIDLYFMDKANESNKSILQLETAEYQMSLLSSIPDEAVIGIMQYDIGNSETENYLQELFDAWVDGDAAKIETLVFEALVEEPELEPYYEMMYDQRNFNIAQKIEEFLLDDEVYFIVVGAGHLVGENGLINLLVNRGYVMEQLDDSN